MGRTACTEPQCLYSRAIPLLPLWAVRPVQSLCACTVQLYLYSPYRPYGLYSTAIPLLPSVPVQYSYTSTPPIGRTACTELQCLYSRAIPLLPLWAVRPVQNLSACTVELYLYSPHWPYGLYRASVPVQVCTLPLPYLSMSREVGTLLPIIRPRRIHLFFSNISIINVIGWWWNDDVTVLQEPAVTGLRRGVEVTRWVLVLFSQCGARRRCRAAGKYWLTDRPTRLPIQSRSVVILTCS